MSRSRWWIAGGIATFCVLFVLAWLSRPEDEIDVVMRWHPKILREGFVIDYYFPEEKRFVDADQLTSYYFQNVPTDRIVASLRMLSCRSIPTVNGVAYGIEFSSGRFGLIEPVVPGGSILHVTESGTPWYVRAWRNLLRRLGS